MPLNIDLLTRQVRRNCDVSDAQHAGMFSVCGLAPRLRDHFKWEHGLRPWEECDSSGLLDWIGAREERWEALAKADYEPLGLGGRPLDPFDAEAVNAALESEGLWYGAGYAGEGSNPSSSWSRSASAPRRAGFRRNPSEPPRLPDCDPASLRAPRAPRCLTSRSR